MEVTDKKYRVSLSFYHKQTFLVKPKANTFVFWAKILSFLKAVKTYKQDLYVQSI
jgi:hypothetical protein